MARKNDLLELARICRKKAQEATNSDVAAEFNRLADDFERRAAAGAQEDDDGEDPSARR